MKTKLLNVWRWFTHGMPEVLLGLFLLTFAPAVVMALIEVGRQMMRFAANPQQFLRAVWKDPWPLLCTLVCFAGLALLIYMIASRWRTIWAVARKMIIEAMHRKVVVILLVFLVVVMPMMPFMLRAEGSLKSHVQIVLLYSLGLALVLMSLVAICVATASICSEVEERYVHITDTKPARRWEFLLGKWFGIVVMCTVILVVMGGTAYGLIHLTVNRAIYGRTVGMGDPLARQGYGREEAQNVDAAEVGIHDYDVDPVRQEVLTARRVTTWVPPSNEEIDRLVERDLKKYRERYKNMRVAVHSEKQWLRNHYLSQTQSVPPDGRILWEFGGLDKDKVVTVRFKAHAVNDRAVWGAWYVYDKDAETGQYTWRMAPDGQDRLKPIVAPARKGWSRDIFHEIRLHEGSVTKEGFLYLGYTSRDPRAKPQAVVVFSVKDFIEVMQVEGGFLGNYYRTMIVFFFQVGLVAALGLLVGSLFSFPVATLLAVAFFVGGLIAPWFYAEFVVPDPYALLTEAAQTTDTLYRGFAGAVLALLPNFGSYSPLDNLIHGKMVTWGHIAEAGAVLFFVKGAAALMIAFFFYTRRELARIIV